MARSINVSKETKKVINFTTPTITLTVEGVDISSQDVYVTLEQGKQELTKTGADLTISTQTEEGVTDTIIVFMLSQEESALFRVNAPVSIQVNWISASGIRAATEIRTIPVMRNLLDEVVEYGN